MAKPASFMMTLALLMLVTNAHGKLTHTEQEWEHSINPVETACLQVKYETDHLNFLVFIHMFLYPCDLSG